MIRSTAHLVLVGSEPEPFTRRAAAHMRAWGRRNDAWMLSLFIMAAASCAAVVLYRSDTNAFLYFGDAVSHLTIARQFVDSRLPGIHNIGTVWLPLPHLLLLPLAMIDELFYSGIAGPLIGIPLLAATGGVTYSIARRLGVSKPVAILAVLLGALNPNLVYLALTPMTELPLFFLAASAALLLLKWIDEDKDRFLLYAAGAVAAASLCRYEAWLCVPFVSILAAKRVRRLMYEGFYNRAAIAFTAVVVAWIGITFWLLWNWTEYGDPLKFIHWTHAIASRTEPAAVASNRFESIRLLGRAIRSIYGPFLLIASASAAVVHLWRGLEKRTLVVFVFASLPAVFALSAVIAGYAQIDEWRWNWRYMLTLGLFVTATAAVGLEALFRIMPSRAARTAIVVGALAIPVIQIAMPSVGISTYIDAKKGFVDETRYATRAGELLKGADISGSIALVAGYSQAQRIMIASGRPLKTFSVIRGPGDDALRAPLWEHAACVVIGKMTKPESQPLVRYWLERRQLLLERYRIVHEDEYYLILRLSPARSSYRAQDRARR